MYFAVAINNAEKVKNLYINDSLLSVHYNTITGNGKWNHMMDQTHIGYTYWQQPPRNKMPEVKSTPVGSSAMKTNDAIKVEEVTLTSTEADIDPLSAKGKINLFYELDGYASMEATHYTRKVDAGKLKWKVIPDIGRDGNGITTFPVTAAEQSVNKNSPHLEYEIYTYGSGEVKLNAYFSPTLNFHNDPDGLRYAISVDDEQPDVISLNKEDNDTKTWSQWVANNIIIRTSTHTIAKAGKHTVKYWMISPAVVLQKIVIDLGGVKPSYLGAPETISKTKLR